MHEIRVVISSLHMSVIMYETDARPFVHVLQSGMLILYFNL